MIHTKHKFRNLNINDIVIRSNHKIYIRIKKRLTQKKTFLIQMPNSLSIEHQLFDFYKRAYISFQELISCKQKNKTSIIKTNLLGTEILRCLKNDSIGIFCTILNPQRTSPRQFNTNTNSNQIRKYFNSKLSQKYITDICSNAWNFAVKKVPETEQTCASLGSSTATELLKTVSTSTVSAADEDQVFGGAVPPYRVLRPAFPPKI